MSRETGRDPCDLFSARPLGALEDRLDRPQDRRHVARSPRVGQGEDRHLGAPGGECLDRGHVDRLAAGPRHELLDLRLELGHVLADYIDEQAARVAIHAAPERAEAFGHPVRKLRLWDIEEEELARFRAGLRQRRVLLKPGTDQRQDGRGGRIAEVGRDRFHIRRLPALGVLDHDRSGADGEEAWCVAGRDGILSACVGCGEHFAAAFSHSRPEPAHRLLDLRTVGAGEEVDGLEVGRHVQARIMRRSREESPGEPDSETGAHSSPVRRNRGRWSIVAIQARTPASAKSSSALSEETCEWGSPPTKRAHHAR